MGLLRIHGRFRFSSIEILRLQVFIDEEEIECTYKYKTCPPENWKMEVTGDPFSGFVFEYKFTLSGSQSISKFEIKFENERIFLLNEAIKIFPADGERWFEEETVLHRENIYGYGPPAKIVSKEVVALAKSLSPPVLDFGCGIGALLRELRILGMEAYGIEVKRPAIAEGLFEDVAHSISLYDGKLPLPFEDNSFESCIANEVLEHIPHFEIFIEELFRIIRKRLIVSVPDISSIPVCYQHKVIPWHLLESTHVNFFNQKSMYNVLKKYFTHIEFARTGSVMINGSRFYVSLAAIADKK